jgi:hypothetical protein
MKYFFLLFIIAGCFDRSDSPEGALRDFTLARLEKVVERDFVVARTTGKMRVSVESMSDEQFRLFSDLRKYKRDTFKIISKSCQEKRCYVTYSLGYHEEAADSKKGWISEVKKIAEIIWVEGKWLIADVSNIKTYHETSTTIDVTP